MGILKQASITEQLAFETTFLRLLISIIQQTKSFEALHDFILLRDLIYSPQEHGHTALTAAIMRRRNDETLNQVPGGGL